MKGFTLLSFVSVCIRLSCLSRFLQWLLRQNLTWDIDVCTGCTLILIGLVRLASSCCLSFGLLYVMYVVCKDMPQVIIRCVKVQQEKDDLQAIRGDIGWPFPWKQNWGNGVTIPGELTLLADGRRRWRTHGTHAVQNIIECHGSRWIFI